MLDQKRSSCERWILLSSWSRARFREQLGWTWWSSAVASSANWSREPSDVSTRRLLENCGFCSDLVFYGAKGVRNVTRTCSRQFPPSLYWHHARHWVLSSCFTMSKRTRARGRKKKIVSELDCLVNQSEIEADETQVDLHYSDHNGSQPTSKKASTSRSEWNYAVHWFATIGVWTFTTYISDNIPGVRVRATDVPMPQTTLHWQYCSSCPSWLVLFHREAFIHHHSHWWSASDVTSRITDHRDLVESNRRH